MSYPVGIPAQLRAGNNLDFAIKCYNTNGDELTSGGSYTAYLVLSNSSNQYSASSTTETEQGYIFSVAYGVTSGWSAGDYTAQVYADDGTNRYEQTTALLEILPSLDSAVDGRSTARQIRDALDSAILGQASSNQLAISIAGRSISRMSLTELIEAKNQYDSLVASEDAKQDIKDGKVSQNMIKTRMKGIY